MRKLVLSKDDRASIRKEMFYHPDPRVMLRMHTLWLNAHHFPQKQIASLLGVSRSTIHRSRVLFRQSS